MAIKKALLSLTVVGVLSLGAAACGPEDYGVAGVDIGFGPPEAHAEVSIGSPGAGYYWVPGYYDWDGVNYVWVPGSWVLPPPPYSVWVAPRYERHGSRFTYYRGHWRGERRDGDRRDRERRDQDRH